MKLSVKLFALIFVLLLAITSSAQNLEETLQNLSEDAAKKYVVPVSSAFTTDMNSGWFNSAPSTKKFGLDVEIGLIAMGAMTLDDDKTFTTTGNFRFSREQAEELVEGLNYPDEIKDLVINEIISEDYEIEISGPTAVGSEDEFVKVVFPGQDITVTDPVTQQSITIPVEEQQIDTPVYGILNEMPILPIAIPQLSIGTIHGTRAIFRYIPPMKFDEDLGEVKYFGFGVQHNPNVWLGAPLPIDIAVGYYTQKLEVGNYLTATTNAFGVNASKKFGGRLLSFTPYAGLMMESATIELNYNYLVDTPAGPEEIPISFDLEGKNKNRITLGFKVGIPLIQLNVDYNIGQQNAASAGLMLSF